MSKTTGKKQVNKKISPNDIFFMGFGLASMAKDQIDSLALFLVKEGKLLAKDQKKFKTDLAKKGEKTYKDMRGEMEKSAATVLKKMNIPTRKEFESLKRKVEKRHGKK